MPTVHIELTGAGDVVVYQPPKNRKIRAVFIRSYNEDVNENKVSVKAVRYDSDGNVAGSRLIDYVPLAPGQLEVITADKLAIYDLDKGEALVTTLSTATASFPVHLTVTYELV